MNLVKRSLMKRRIKGRIRAFKKIKALVKALLLSTLNLLIKPWLASSSYFLLKLAKRLTQGLYQI